MDTKADTDTLCWIANTDLKWLLFRLPESCSCQCILEFENKRNLDRANISGLFQFPGSCSFRCLLEFENERILDRANRNMNTNMNTETLCWIAKTDSNWCGFGAL